MLRGLLLRRSALLPGPRFASTGSAAAPSDAYIDKLRNIGISAHIDCTWWLLFRCVGVLLTMLSRGSPCAALTFLRLCSFFPLPPTLLPLLPAAAATTATTALCCAGGVVLLMML
jgi:hypothetical protein